MPNRRLKDTKMIEIENNLCVRIIMNVALVFQIEIEPWGAISTLITFNYGVYTCSCSLRYDEYMCNKKHAFVYESNLKPLHQSKCCGDLIDNGAYATICVL